MVLTMIEDITVLCYLSSFIATVVWSTLEVGFWELRSSLKFLTQIKEI